MIFIPDCYEAFHTAPPPGLRLFSEEPPNNTQTHTHTQFSPILQLWYCKSARFASINSVCVQKRETKHVMRRTEKKLSESHLHQPVTHTHTHTNTHRAHTQPVPNHTSSDPGLRSFQTVHICSTVILHTACVTVCVCLCVLSCSVPV